MPDMQFGRYGPPPALIAEQMRQMAAQQQARRAAGPMLYQMFGQGQGGPPPPMAGPGGMAPPPAGTPQGGPMPPPPGANPAAGPPPGGGMPSLMGGMQAGIPQPPMGGPPTGPAAGAAPPAPAAPPPQIQPFRPLPSPAPQMRSTGGGIAPPPAAPAAPAPAGEGLSDPGKQFNLGGLIKQLQGSGVPPDKVMDMLDQLSPVMTAQNKQELDFFKAHNTALQQANQTYSRLMTAMAAQTRAGTGAQAEERRTEQGGKRLDQGQQKVDLAKKKFDFETGGAGGGFSPKDVAYWTEVLQKGGSLPPRLATTPGGKMLLQQVMKGVAGGDVKPVEMLANQAEFMGEKAGQRTLGTRTANIEMAATEAAGLSNLALKASDEWKRTGIKSLNDLEKYAQGKTSSPTLRRFVAANTSFINAYARAINPQGVGTVADKEHAREMLEVGFAKDDYAAAIDQLQSEISVAQKSPGKVKESMRERFTGSGRQLAPQGAIEYLRAHPETAQQFSAKYGYLPAEAR